jgi:hypothetical protein
MLHLDARVKVGIHAQEDLPAAQLLPDDVETLKAMLLAERQAHRAEVRDQALLIEKLEHQIAELLHDRFGQSSERRALRDQLELQLSPDGSAAASALGPARGATLGRLQLEFLASLLRC